MNLDHYLSTNVNVQELARASVQAGMLLLRGSAEHVLSTFMGTSGAQLRVLHDNIRARGFVGTQRLDYTYRDTDGNLTQRRGAVQGHVFVQPSDDYDYLDYRSKLFLQETLSANLLELPASQDDPAQIEVSYHNMLDALHRRGYVRLGTNPINGYHVYAREL